MGDEHLPEGNAASAWPKDRPTIKSIIRTRGTSSVFPWMSRLIIAYPLNRNEPVRLFTGCARTMLRSEDAKAELARRLLSLDVAGTSSFGSGREELRGERSTERTVSIDPRRREDNKVSEVGRNAEKLKGGWSVSMGN